jgi:hypothetical protein
MNPYLQRPADIFTVVPIDHLTSPSTALTWLLCGGVLVVFWLAWRTVSRRKEPWQ